MPSKPAARAGDAGAISTAGLGVLGVVAEAPTHGFAVAAVFAADGALGRVWRVQRAVVYRELGRLADAGLVQPVGVETDGPGPDRTIVQLTARGRGTLDRWLDAPVRRPRDARSELLLKLALLDRAGRDAGTLIAAQRTVFAARLTELRAAVRTTESGSFDHTLALWRLSSTQAVLDFLTALCVD